VDATKNKIYQFPGDIAGKRQDLESCINSESSPDSVFVSYLSAGITEFVEETSQHY
jgi:hypothetical protein